MLIVDDNATNRIVAQTLLEAFGCAVTTAEDGFDALARLRVQRFDAVLMDIHMPRMDGPAALAAIRAGEAGDPAIPVVALTADVMTASVRSLKELGFDGVQPKPIDPEGLVAALAGPAGEVGRLNRDVRWRSASVTARLSTHERSRHAHQGRPAGGDAGRRPGPRRLPAAAGRRARGLARAPARRLRRRRGAARAMGRGARGRLRHALVDLDPVVRRACRLPLLLAAGARLLGEPFFISQVEGREPLQDNGYQSLHRDGAGRKRWSRP